MAETSGDRKWDTRLAEALLRGGVGLRHVRRCLRELGDHRDDLVAALRDQGLDARAAEIEAQLRLGNQQQFIAQMIARPELRSRARRFAWLLFLVGPLFMVCLLGLLAVGAVAGVAQVIGVSTGLYVPSATEVMITRALLQWLIPVAVGMWLCRAALQRRISAAWPVCAMAITALTAGGVYYGVTPDPGGKPLTELAFGPYPLNGMRVVVLFVALMLGYLLLRRHAVAAATTGATP